MAVWTYRTEVPLVLGKAHLDLRRVFVDGHLKEFSVNYRIQVAGRWYGVVRYDNCHGEAHVHRFFENGTPKPLPKVSSLTELLDAAETDLSTNWRTYRKRMVALIRQLKELSHPREDS